MKTIAHNWSVKRWMVLFCLVLSAMLARSQSSGGIFANDGVATRGNVVIDSFDSSDPNHSIWQTSSYFRRNYFNPSGTQYGTWSDSLSYISNSYPSRTAHVSVFTESNAIILSAAIVAGYVMTGPTATVSGTGSYSVGDLAWCFGPTGTAGGQTTIEFGHWITNVNVNLQSYPLPSPINPINGWMNWSNVPAPPKNAVISIGGMWTNSAGVWSYVGGTRYTNTGSGFTIGGTTYPLVITNRLENTNWVYYSMSQLSQSIFVDAQYVVLYLTNGLTYPGRTVFTLNTNADIKIITTGSIDAGALGTINNLGNDAHAFTIQDVLGYPVSVSLAGNAMAPGNYFLPSSTLMFTGTGDFVGSITCYSLNDDAGISIHYDESLGTSLSSPTVQALLSYDFIPAKDWFICHLVGVTGLDYTIDASTDLVNWVPVWTNTSPFVFTDTNVNNYQQRFFRPVPGP